MRDCRNEYHQRLRAIMFAINAGFILGFGARRLKMVCDELVEMFPTLNANPLDFPGYEKKIKQYQEQTGDTPSFAERG